MNPHVYGRQQYVPTQTFFAKWQPPVPTMSSDKPLPRARNLQANIHHGFGRSSFVLQPAPKPVVSHRQAKGDALRSQQVSEAIAARKQRQTVHHPYPMLQSAGSKGSSSEMSRGFRTSQPESKNTLKQRSPGGQAFPKEPICIHPATPPASYQPARLIASKHGAAQSPDDRRNPQQKSQANQNITAAPIVQTSAKIQGSTSRSEPGSRQDEVEPQHRQDEERVARILTDLLSTRERPTGLKSPSTRRSRSHSEPSSNRSTVTTEAARAEEDEEDMRFFGDGGSKKVWPRAGWFEPICHTNTGRKPPQNTLKRKIEETAGLLGLPSVADVRKQKMRRRSSTVSSTSDLRSA